jgi:hypothetical protein
MYFKTTLLSVAIFMVHHLSAQTLSGGISLNLINYQGDLVKGIADFKESKLGVGVLIRKELNDKFAIKGNLDFGKISGNDANYTTRKARGLSFSSPLTEIAASVEWSFLGKSHTDLKGDFIKRHSPYISFGLGFTITNPTVTGLASNSPDKTAKISKTNFSLPIGIGYRFDINEQTAFAVHVVSRSTFSDYLDGVSKAANPAGNDRYFMSGVTLLRHFGIKSK